MRTNIQKMKRLFIVPPMPTMQVVQKGRIGTKLDLAFNNVKPNDWYFVLDLVRVRTELGCVRLTRARASFLVPNYYPSKS